MSDADKLAEAVERAEQRLARAESDARDLIVFADGAEEAGLVMYAQRGRVIARDLLRIAGELRAERSVRGSIQAERDRLRELLSRYASGAAA